MMLKAVVPLAALLALAACTTTPKTPPVNRPTPDSTARPPQGPAQGAQPAGGY